MKLLLSLSSTFASVIRDEDYTQSILLPDDHRRHVQLERRTRSRAIPHKCQSSDALFSLCTVQMNITYLQPDFAIDFHVSTRNLQL